MDPIKIGIIGCGYWGPNLIRNFYELKNSDLVAVADLREERLDHIKDRYTKIETIKDYRDLFTMGLDAAVVATPPFSHYHIAKDCLKHDLSVFVEKPITLNSGDAEDLIRIAEEKDLRLMVGHTFEYNSAINVLKEIIQSGELGEVYYLDAARLNLGLYQPKSNVVWDLAPHDISILLYLLETDPISVSAQGSSSVFKGVHDNAYLHMEFPENIIANIHVSWLEPCKVRRITIVGSQKMAVFNDLEPAEKIRVYDKGVEVPPYTNTFNEFQLNYRYGDVLIRHIPFVEPLRVECNHFVECVQNRTVPKSDGRVGLKVVKVIEAATRSLENGGGQEITFPEEVRISEESVI
jgi:predicted dehydrogenase